jgi:uncharacterized membrane protein YvbJ
MPYCPKCGSEVKEEMTFCPRCGASLKTKESSQTMPVDRYRGEKTEKQEKQEKQEKNEKNEKGEQQEKFEKQQYGILGPLVGGLILILIGVMFYLSLIGVFTFRSIFPFVLIIIGAIVIVGVLVGSLMAKGRNPKT